MCYSLYKVQNGRAIYFHACSSGVRGKSKNFIQQNLSVMSELVMFPIEKAGERELSCEGHATSNMST